MRAANQSFLSRILLFIIIQKDGSSNKGILSNHTGELAEDSHLAYLEITPLLGEPIENTWP
jgi:hypothetical protein